MSLILSGTDGLSDVDGSAATPAIRGTDSNTGIFFPAADTIAFAEGGVEVARFDSAGNFGVGTTIPASFGKLAVNGVASMLTNGLVRFYNSANNNWSFIDNPSTDGSAFLRFATGAGEAARIDPSGNLLVGTTSNRAASKLDIRGDVMTLGSNASFFATIDYSAGAGLLSIAAESGGGIAFKSGTTERMRIDSSGNLIVGDTGADVTDGVLRVKRTGASYVARLQNTNASTPSGLSVFYSGGAPNGTASPFIFCEDSSALRMSVRSNGGIANFSGNDVNLSDRREKTNFAPAKSYLETLCAIPVQTFNYIDQNMEDDPGLTLGVVAQDVQEVAPELVMESNWGTKEEPKQRLSIYQTDLQYALMKCIQEQQVLIQEIKAELATLKGAA